MLLVNCTEADDIAITTLCEDGYLRDNCRKFITQQQDCFPSDSRCLCLLQGEQAFVQHDGQRWLLGSQDATTCLNVLLFCPNTHNAWMAHMDRSPSTNDAATIHAALLAMKLPQLYMAGGYADAGGQGIRLSQALVQWFHALRNIKIHLELLCVGGANTAGDGSPLTRQLVLDTQSGAVHPWLFTQRGPQLARRFAAQHCRCAEHLLVCTQSSAWLMSLY